MERSRDNAFNNFDLVRTFFALMVVFSHLYALSLIQEIAWFIPAFHGDFAIKGFFTISGYLVMRSFIYSKNNSDFFKKRFMRIYPAYFTIIMFCLLIGFLFSTKRLEFLKSADTLKYILANLSFLNTLHPGLPGVFESNPLQALNGSLWTIKEEICLYCCIPFMYVLFKKWNTVFVMLGLVLLSLSWLYFFNKIYTGAHATEMARQAPGQLSYFAIGAFLFINDRVFKYLYLYVLVFALAYFLFLNEPIKYLFEPFFYSSLTIYLCTQAFKNLHFARFGDLAFGIYLYHFPIIQALIWTHVFSENIYLGIALTLIFTISLALMSWHCVEKRFLRKNSHYIKASQKQNDLLPLDGSRGLS